MSEPTMIRSIDREPMTLDELITILDDAQQQCGPEALIGFEQLGDGKVRLLVIEPDAGSGASSIKLYRDIDVGGVGRRR